SWYRRDGAGETLLQDFNGRPMAPMAVAGQTVGMRVPFGAVPTWATNGTRVALGLGVEPEVLVFERAETNPHVFRWSATPGALTASNLEIGRHVYGEEAGAEAGILPGWEDFPLPDTEPSHARVLVSRSGAVWVQEYRRSIAG